jgi:tetratricopeptide (TPR) repeat protein
MKTLLPLLLIAATACAADKVPDELGLLDTRELHNRGTLRLQQGDLVGAEEALKASLARNDDVLRLPALHNLGHVRFGRGKATLGGKTVGDVTELSIARSYIEASDADISDMKDQIEIIDKAKAAGKEPDYVPAVSALGGGIGTYRTVKKLIPKEEAMVAKRAGVIASWIRSVGDFRSAHELDNQDQPSLQNAEAIEELLRALKKETQALEETIADQRKKQEELREVIRELAKRIPPDKLPQNAEGEGDDDENFLPEGMQKPKNGKGGKTDPREGQEKRMSEQEARSSLESLKGEFGRKMPTSDQPGNGPGGNKPSSDSKKKDY